MTGSSQASLTRSHVVSREKDENIVKHRKKKKISSCRFVEADDVARYRRYVYSTLAPRTNVTRLASLAIAKRYGTVWVRVEATQRDSANNQLSRQVLRGLGSWVAESLAPSGWCVGAKNEDEEWGTKDPHWYWSQSSVGDQPSWGKDAPEFSTSSNPNKRKKKIFQQYH